MLAPDPEGGVVVGRSGRRAVGLAIAAAALVAGVVVFGVKGRRSAEPAASAPQSEIAAPPPAPPRVNEIAAPAPTPKPPAVNVGAQVEPPPAEAKAPVPPTRPVVSTNHPAKLEPSKKSAAAKQSKKAASNETEHRSTPAAKPNCAPNFTLDAQGQKHFKPECF